jgi:hypothetical protein
MNQFGRNTIGGIGLGGYRVSADPTNLAYKLQGVTLDWAQVPVYGNEVQSVTITGGPTGGTYTLTFAGQTTSGIAHNATAATVQTALAALSTIGAGNVVVTGDAGGPYRVEFVGALAYTNVAQMTATSSLTGGSSPGVTIATVDQGGAALPGGVVTQAGERVLRAGTIIYKDAGTGQYRPWVPGITLVRGECYIVDRHCFGSIDLPVIGEVFDFGRAIHARLRVGGFRMPTLADFLTAFPGVQLHKD